jgi:hypothetical protein
VRRTVTARQSQYWKVASCEGTILLIVMLATLNRLLAGLIRNLRTSIITRFESGDCAPDQLYLAQEPDSRTRLCRAWDSLWLWPRWARLFPPTEMLS